MKKIKLSAIIIIAVIVTGSLLVYLVFDINNTKKYIAKSLIEKSIQNVTVSLNGFFNPIRNALLSTKDQASMDFFDDESNTSMNNYFVPMIKYYPQLSYMGVGNSDGYEIDVIPNNGIVNNRCVFINSSSKEIWTSWKEDTISNKWILTKTWEDIIKNDPRERPWFTGAIKAKKNQVNWTNPYIYNTTFEPGITASVKYLKPNDNKAYILAFDLTLTDITSFTQNISMSKNGKAFVLSKSGQYIGLPKDSSLNSSSQIKKTILSHVDSIQIPEVTSAYNIWKSNKNLNEPFRYKTQNEYWQGRIIKYKLSHNNYFLIGIIIPEKDILGKIEKTKTVVIFSFIFIFLLAIGILYFYLKLKKTNLALNDKNDAITLQKLLIEDKNKEILDSISYAKRIQSAILPSKELIENSFSDSFIIYIPKDIVAGDFYWLEQKDNKILFAAADCTGHGVPGAMVSVICNNGLNKSVREHRLTDPGKILNKTREIVLKQFEKSEDEVKDGMDIALCSLEGNTLKYAGANNPLWILRKNDTVVEEIKADKQPIGQFDNPKPYTTHTIELEKGDNIYIFSDGFADQFGGEKGKKFKTLNFKNLLLSIQNHTMKEQETSIKNAFEKWKGDLEQVDDICIIGVRV
ncbi:MAG: SpoIIE family protein phosphatase [Vicingus serpentipes]|nr:SpoIIE family protein phosphatase [Vicingus serpentipes]